MTKSCELSTGREHFSVYWVILSAAAFIFGAYLRYYFIFRYNRAFDAPNIIGDAEWYVWETVKLFEPGYVPTLFDTLFPPGAPFYFGVLRSLDPSFTLLYCVQWLLATSVPLILCLIGRRLYGRKNGYFALIFSSLYYPLWEYFGFFMSEGPFLFSLLLSILFLILSLQTESKQMSLIWGLLAGMMLGASAACKSCSLFTAIFVGLSLTYCRLRKGLRPESTILAALLGLALVLTPVSFHASKINQGRFLLIANDAPRTFLLGHQGRVGLTWWYDDVRDFHMNFINPSAFQHDYHETLTYHFGVYESLPNYSAGIAWIQNNPLESLLLSIEHVFDLFMVLQWPDYFRPTVGWAIFFNQVFLVLILAPVCVHLWKIFRQTTGEEPFYSADLLLFSAVCSIFVLAFLFLGEPRYRICYDGILILLASRTLVPAARCRAAIPGRLRRAV